MPSQSNLDVAFEILDACNGNSIACVNSYGRSYSEGYYNNNFVVGQTYTIKVFLSDQITHDANIEIAVIDIPQPVNDECANATTLNIMTDNSTLTNGNLGGATESISACSGTVANDVWFSFVANATELSIYTGAESQLDTVFEIYDACNGNSLVCVDDNGMNFSETVTYSNFTIGQTYYLRVFGKNALYYNKSFGIVVYNPNASITDTSNIDTNWQISPNPVNDVLFINCQNELLQTQVVISNLSGQILLNNSLISHRIDVADLPKGIYFIHLFSQGKDMGVNRFIVE
jgi:DNA-directed RNA polymerase subunit L